MRKETLKYYAKKLEDTTQHVADYEKIITTMEQNFNKLKRDDTKDGEIIRLLFDTDIDFETAIENICRNREKYDVVSRTAIAMYLSKGLKTQEYALALLTMYPKKGMELIHPFTDELDFAWKEPVMEDFISREEFINRTGIFVTPLYFRCIYDDFKESNVSVDDFVNNYEEKYCICVQEVPLTGTFKYDVNDVCLSCISEYDAEYDPNIWEIINCLARNAEHTSVKKEEFTEQAMDLIEKQKKTNEELIGIVKELAR